MEHPTKLQVQAARMRAVDMFAQDLTNTDIANRLGVARQTVSRWKQIWLKHGLGALDQDKRGPKPRIGDQEWQGILDLLTLGAVANGYDTDLWTLERIADLIESKTGTTHCISRIWQLLKQSGWSCKKPERRAKERKEEAIALWKSETWPNIKKGRKIAVPF